eukprot:4206500-Karenia_brevis.AAC.1
MLMAGGIPPSAGGSVARRDTRNIDHPFILGHTATDGKTRTGGTLPKAVVKRDNRTTEHCPALAL